MCPMTTPTASCFDWNKTPYLVKEKIVDNLPPRTLPVFASLSRECHYLYSNLRSLRVVDSVSISIRIDADGSFRTEIIEGEDVDEDVDKSENILDRNASSHLGVEFNNSEKTFFENDLKKIKKFLKHVHAVESMELDISCRDTKEAKLVLDEIWEELSRGFQSIHKLILHRIPNEFLSSVFRSCEKLDSLSLLSTRKSYDERISPKILHQALQQLPNPLHRFVCDYLIRPNDDLLDLVSKNFSEGFYQWNRVERALRGSADLIEKISTNNLPAAFRMMKSGSEILVGLVKPYRAFL